MATVPCCDEIHLVVTPDTVLKPGRSHDQSQEIAVNNCMFEAACKHLSKLARIPDGSTFAASILDLREENLESVVHLDVFTHVQTLHLQQNKIKDLAPIAGMKSLSTLNASHNRLTALFNFTPPHLLAVIDLSHNSIREMGDLSGARFLCKITLSFNSIESISGLTTLRFLEVLDLSHNRIAVMEGLDHLNLRHLDLSFNQIERIEDLSFVESLQTLSLAGNAIKALSGLEKQTHLTALDMEANEVSDAQQLTYLKHMRFLAKLNLRRNPVHSTPGFRLLALFELPQLTNLDKRQTTVEETVKAKLVYDPSREWKSSRTSMQLMLTRLRQPLQLLHSSLPNLDTPYPILILTGPPGSGKQHLAWRLVAEYSAYFRFGTPHTTRPMRRHEKEGENYHFVSEEDFQKDVNNGKFYETTDLWGHRFALSMNAIEEAAQGGLATVTHMDLDGVLQMKRTHFQPRCVLTIPLSPKVHEERMWQRSHYRQRHIQQAVLLASEYRDYHQDHPGLFETGINTDNLETAYRALKRLVHLYLGLDPPSDATSIVDGDDSFSMTTGESESTLGTHNSAAPSSMTSRSASRASDRRRMVVWSRPTSGSSVTTTRSTATSLSFKPLFGNRTETPEGRDSSSLLDLSRMQTPKSQHFAEDGGQRFRPRSSGQPVVSSTLLDDIEEIKTVQTDLSGIRTPANSINSESKT